ncbi:hypothetical protein [Aeromicrobium sp. IC_218]|uniref:hypothetical protein n=1 Tax=Aeromicrobium sp. IC_218 TaxID=2545468 RepID=UPI00103AA33D|nr:hypothetical protein [Aeromicrobium sp. IC_218]TCI98723.1 hypothetical protein E0W78_10165 [Aeromicrobium sp. IC_218]
MTSSASEQERRERLRRAAALLGDLEPSTTRDETAEGWGERSTGSRDDELRRDVPPHHGG